MTITPILAHGGPLLYLMGVATVGASIAVGGIAAICCRKRHLGVWLILISIALTIAAFVWFPKSI
jgi:hypothetical protein